MPELRPANPPTRWRLIRSFGYALRGVWLLVTSQANARIHAVATVAVIGAGCWLRIERWEWCSVLGAISLVWTAEGLNTALEALTDLASPHEHPLAGRAKDLAAGAVLCAAVVASVIGAIVFLPHVLG